MGLALRTLGRSEDAVSHFREALRLEPDKAVVHYNLAVDLENIQRIEEATMHYTDISHLGFA